ncbi:MAG: enoyl-CoA hydratase [Candidatus Arcticimaribacter sp.]|nr:enoyl-CoA hydratase-related protein [Flavobacteriaceae bacterium]PSR09405.1 MAG: enoyl-CoA hydratase [Candidatus Arcticimaribacter sp.]
MSTANLQLRIQDQVAWIQIDRPTKLNALNRVVLEELNQVFSDLRTDVSVRVIVLTGSGEKAFVAGADIAEFSEFGPAEGRALAQKGQDDVFTFIEQMNKPVIAAINGFALGGGLELAMSCHIRIASANAKMGLPETSLGVIPGYGGTQRLAQIIGKGRAMELILSCQMLPADQALNFGLVTQVVPQEELLPAAAALAQKILKNSPFAIGQAIQAVNAAYDEGLNGFEAEVNGFGTCFGSEDFKEGTQAFLEKRKANFTGN